MTVHSLPPLDAQLPDASTTRMGRVKMLLILLVAASPVLASYFTYYVVRPDARHNYGELIDPQRPMPSELSGLNNLGEAVTLEQLRHQWLFISVADSACSAQCEAHLYMQRQIREGLGREKDRVDWVWLRTTDTPLTDDLRSATETAVVLQMEEATIATWLQPMSGQQLSDHLYVVDPLGNWMMRFPPDADPNRIRRDLNRLLRASSFWDRPGRT